MDWLALFEDQHIEYVTSGPNTKKGEVSVKCPWCGDADPSQHMGINLSKEAWGCHRDQRHRGKSPIILTQALLNCSNSQAKLTVEQYSKPDPESLDEAVLALTGEKEAPVKPAGALKLPAGCQGIAPGSRFYRYLHNRGFDEPMNVASIYGLKSCTVGRCKDRIIIPIYQNGKLVAWTGRAINQTINAPRYLSSDGNTIKNTVYREDELRGGSVLFVTEGPFDAMKVDYYGFGRGGHATAVFGTSITIDQIVILSAIAKRYKRTVILLDPEAIESAFNLSDWIPRAEIGILPSDAEDPGALTKDQVKTLVKSYQN